MSELTDFFKKMKDQKEQGEQNTRETLKVWLKVINDLFSNIKEWVSEAIKDGTLTVTDVDVQLNEPDFGIAAYTAPSLRFESSGRTVNIIPRGRFVIGAKGRIEMISAIRQIVYPFIVSQSTNRWIYAPEKGGPSKPLDKELFNKLFIEAFDRAFSR